MNGIWESSTVLVLQVLYKVEIMSSKSYKKSSQSGGDGWSRPTVRGAGSTGRLGAASSAGNSAGAGLLVPQEWRAQVTSQQFRPVVLNRADFVLLGTFGNVW